MIKRWAKGLIMSLGMFSVLPVPHIWDDSAMNLVIPMLSVVGLIIGGLWRGAALLLLGTDINVISILLVALLPCLLSGFIHVDGLMDTADAVFSRRSLDERRRILKDSHVGAFAVIVLICFLMFLFAAMYEVSGKQAFLPLLFIPVLSRCMSGLSLLVLKPMSETGYGGTFRANTNTAHCVFLSAVIVLCFAGAYLLGCPLVPLLAVPAAAVPLAAYLYRQFEGISGDLCGAIICGAELAGLMAFALV